VSLSRTRIELSDLPGGRRLFWLLEVPAAVLLALERVFFSAALLLLVIASYAWWGNESSPLGVLWKVSVVCGVLWLLSLVGHIVLIKRARKHHHRASWAYMDTIDELDVRAIERELKSKESD